MRVHQVALFFEGLFHVGLAFIPVAVVRHEKFLQLRQLIRAELIILLAVEFRHQLFCTLSPEKVVKHAFDIR